MSNMDSELPKGENNDDSSRKKAANHKNKSNWKKAEIVAVFAIIEIISLVLWQKAEDFSGVSAKYIHWISECGFLAGGAYLAHEFTKKRILIWFSYAVLCLILFLTKSVESKPNFVLSLQIGDSPASKVFLTNDFLFNRRIVKVGDLPNGAIKFNGFVNGCLVIPVQSGESNKVFNFIVENDSAVKVTDLEVAVGFPKVWECGFDPKWHKVEQSLIIPGAWKFEATNMQYVVAQSPWVLFPYDTLTFPAITNPCIPEYIGSTFKGGFVEIAIRSTGFENILAANILFLPDSSNSFKPFVTLGKIGSDGLLRLLTSQEEFEKSQK
jgi:hypothetical protein